MQRRGSRTVHRVTFESSSSGGGWGGPIAAIFTAMIAAVMLGPVLRWLEIALAGVGMGAAIGRPSALRHSSTGSTTTAAYATYGAGWVLSGVADQ
jgi:hypothetical protein